MKYILTSLLSFWFCNSSAQTDVIEAKSITCHFTNEKIIIDGLEEGAWAKAKTAEDFIQNAPIDNVAASEKTEVKILSDDKNIYIFATCYGKNNHIVTTLKRDQFGDSDGFAVLLDPQGQKTNGYGFGVTVLGSQTEVLIQGDNSDSGWDNKWFSSVKRSDDKWVVEMAIPFKSIRYSSLNENWKINFLRQDPGLNETHVWSPVPRQFDETDLGYFGNLVFERRPFSSGKNIAIIPYANTSNSKEASNSTKTSFDVGGDAKVAITSSLNLDLTANPDFSQVDVDQQVTNLSRFSIFFPERRQFFIENGDVFSGFGVGENQLFYSRRIGLDDNGRTVPITYGARLTGNLSDKTRIGFFNIHSQNNEKIGNNFTAFTAQQRILKRSQIRGIFLNRQSYQGSDKQNDYGRNVGVDFTLSTADGKLSGFSGYMQSMKPVITNLTGQQYGGINYNGTNFQAFVEVQHTAKNFYADMGFNSRVENYDEDGNVIRIGYTSIGSMIDYNYYPKESKTINVKWSGLENFVYLNDEGSSLNEWYTRLRHFIFFKNTSAIRFRLNNNFQDVLYGFNLRDAKVEKGKYNNTEFNIQYNSDRRKLVSGQLFAVYGSFYEGTKFTYRANLIGRVQPWGNFSFGLEDNIIKLPNQVKNTHISLASLKAEINLSTKLFFTNFLQYNAQSNFFNYNSRIQYRYAPMSDIFFVVTDSYNSDLRYFNRRDLNVILKVSCWLGV